MRAREAFKLGPCRIPAGTRKTVNLPVSVMSDHTPVTLSVHVVHGRLPGPTLFVSAAVHGDEVIGVEILRRLLHAASLDTMRGTLLAIPIVNSLGFMNHSRYLPDRRDLNRSFPGRPEGSLASRLAYLFMQEIVLQSDLGIDLHSAAVHRSNLPQIRISPSKPATAELAEAFGSPLILMSKIRSGTLRHTAQEHGVDILVYEAGEGLRFDEFAVRAGVTGVLRVMRHLGMVSGRKITKPKTPSIRSASSFWVRAPAGGLLRMFKDNGEEVEKDVVLGIISDPFGEVETEVVAQEPGLVIGRTRLPVVNEGDGLFHIARLRRDDDATATVESLTAQLGDDPLFDEDEII